MSRDRVLGAHSSLIFEEIKSRPCVWNSWEAGLTFLCCRLSRVLTADIIEGGFCFQICSRGKYVALLTECGSLIIRFVIVVTELNVLAYRGSAVRLSLERVSQSRTSQQRVLVQRSVWCNVCLNACALVLIFCI